MQIPKIQIVIPTCNRHKIVEKRVDNLTRLLNRFEIDYALLISDNCPNCNHAFAFENQAIEVKIISPNKFLKSAEENLLYALKNSDDGLVWICGDDDFISENDFCKLMSILSSHTSNEKYAAFFINNKYVSEKGYPLRTEAEIDIDSIKPVSSRDLILKHGLIGALAGFSNWIIRFNSKDLTAFERIINDISPIYSHVTWILTNVVSNGLALEINLPLVTYTKNLHDFDGSQHWKKYAQSRGEPHNFSWHTNLLRQLSEFESAGILTIKTANSIIESASSGKRFLLASFIFKKYMQDLKNRTLRDADVAELINWLITYQPFPEPIIRFTVQTLEELSFGQIRAADAVNELLKLINSWEIEYNEILFPFYIGKYFRFDVYDHLGTYYALCGECSKQASFLKASGEGVSNLEILRDESLDHILLSIIHANSCKLDKQFSESSNSIHFSKNSILFRLWKRLPNRAKKNLRKLFSNV